MSLPFLQAQEEETLQEYIAFLEEVYQEMTNNYYRPVEREAFDLFIEQFKTKIYPQLTDTGKSIDYVRWRSANLMVEKLRDKDDIFSTFYPPQPAKEYKETALGKRVDLGIEGEKSDKGYVTTHVEPRSDAYIKGLRIGDILLKIDGKRTSKLSAEKIKEFLKPLEDSTVKILFQDVDANNKKKTIEVVTTEYFKQTVFMCPTEAPGVFCFQIPKFNRKTSEDLMLHLQFMRQHDTINGIILDMRGNPGGPPLAAREISSFFLPAGEEFAYFQKQNQPKMSLDVPKIPDQYKYAGPIAILVDKDSGSSTELFSGILQRRGRAVVLGENTAGQVFLKSMFPFEDESMLLLVTGRGHHPDGAVFSFDGVTPNHTAKDEAEKANLINMASLYLVMQSRK